MTLFSLRPFCWKLPAEFAQVVVRDAVQLALAVTFEPQHETRRAAHEAHERVGEALLAELGERHVLHALAVFDDELVRPAYAGGLRALRLLARIDERDLKVRLRAPIRPQALLDQLVQVRAGRVLATA